jgi:hypothetical protein
MFNALSEIQKQLFLNTSGKEYIVNNLSGHFMTEYPYNNREWKYSAWDFTFIIEPDTGDLICELAHRMTNNRIFGWDREGNELNNKITDKYFTSHF